MDVKVYSLAADGDKYLTPHFQVKEFRCRDGSDVVLIHEQLPWDLESIRYQASQEHGKGKEIPLIINSGYRTVAYNSTLKNASKHSQHLYGYAADIHMPGVSIKDLKRYARNVSDQGRLDRLRETALQHSAVGRFFYEKKSGTQRVVGCHSPVFDA